MSGIDKHRARATKGPAGTWRVHIVFFLGCFLCLTFFSGLETARAQTTVDAGGFRVQFWNQGDNGGSGAFVLNRTIADANLGTFTEAEQTAVVRAFEYWTDKLGLSTVVTEQSPIIRVAKDDSKVNGNASASSVSTTSVTPGFDDEVMQKTNMYSRLLEATSPNRNDGIDGRIVLEPGQTGGIVNTYNTDRITQLMPGDLALERTTIHEIGHLLGYTGSNDPHGQFLNVVDGTNFAQGPNALSLFGGNGVPVQSGSGSHTLLEYHNLTRGKPFGESFRNIPYFTPAELIILRDMGYTGLNLDAEFGTAQYHDGTGAPETITETFSSSADYAVGLFVQADSRDITQSGNVTLSGFAGAGVRIAATDTVTNGNTVTIAAGTTLDISGEDGIGILASSGAANQIVHRGDITTNGADGIGMLFDFGPPLTFSSTSQIDSSDYNDYLVDQIDLTGSITAQNGTGNVIQIAETAAVREINIMSGTSLTGNILSDALTNTNLNRPTITFGKLSDGDGRATIASDSLFLLNYDGNISGSTLMDADLVGGLTRFNGSVSFQSLNIGLGTALGGTGTVTSQTAVNNQGAIAPGNSIGTMTIIGDMTSSGTFSIEVLPSTVAPIPGTHNDLIDVSGSATINGGVVDVDGTPGNYQVGHVYTFLTAAGGVTVNTAPAYMDHIDLIRIIPVGGANRMAFQILRDASFAAIGQTPNEMSFGAYFDSVKSTPDVDLQQISTLFDSLPTDLEVRVAMNQLLGDIYGSLPIVGVQHTSHMLSLLSNQMDWGGYADCCQDDCRRTTERWVIGYELDGGVDSDGNAVGLDHSVSGMAFGVSRWLNDFKRVGLFGGRGNMSTHTTAPTQWVDADNAMLGGFLHSHDGRNYYLLAGAAGYDDLTTSRQINFGGFDRIARSNFEGSQAAGYLERGWDVCWGHARLRTLGSLQYIYLHQEGFTETGAGGASLTVAPLNVHSLRSNVGARLAWDRRMPRGGIISPHVGVAWQHEHLDTSAVVTSGFGVATPPTFAARGLDLGRDRALLGVGITLSSCDNLSLTFAYDAQLNSRQTFHVGSGRLAFVW